LEDPEPSLYLIGLGLCFLLLAFTSAADAAFTAISRHRLNIILNDGGSRARRAVSRLIDDPYRFKSTIIFLNAAATISITAVTLKLSAGLLLWQQVLSLGLLLLAMLVVSEVVPKALAVRNPDATAKALAVPLSALARLLWPLISLLNLLTRPLFVLLSGRTAHPAPLVTEEELRLLVNVGEEEGLIEQEERAMIEGVFAFGDTLVREIMVPRVDIVALERSTPLSRSLDVVVARGHSRIPVYDESLDTIVGILYAKDLIPALRDGGVTTIENLLRPAYFVPETMRVNALLEDMQRRKTHMALIVDEYGGTSGLATIEDLVEQIVGEIQDEYDTEDPSVQPAGDGVFIVDARVPIDDINDLLGTALRSDSADRIGGLVYEQLGRIPRPGDQIMLEEAEVTVQSVKGVRAQRLRVARRAPVEEEGDAGNLLVEGRLHGPA